MQRGPIPSSMKPLEWLIGKWKSVSVTASYRKPFTYEEELSFECWGQPVLIYDSVSWNPESKEPMHLEKGYLKLKPESDNEVALLAALKFGITSIEEGTVVNNQLKLKSKSISRVSFAKEDFVQSLERCYTLREDGRMEYVLMMDTDKIPLKEHLRVVYERY